MRFLAPLASIILPGLGQALVGAWRRGLLLLLSLGTIVGLLAWRIRIVGRREDEFGEIVRKAFSLQPILLAVAIGAALIYLWVIVDAYLAARRKRGANSAGLWLLILVAYFALGWQIGDINLVTLATQSRDAAPFMQRILWPWEAAIHREEVHLVGRAEIRIPCSGTPPAPLVPGEGEPSLIADPACGDLSTQDCVQGSTLHVFCL